MLNDQKIVKTIYSDARCVTSKRAILSATIFYAIFRYDDGVPISDQWHDTEEEAWAAAANMINMRMLRKLGA